MKKPAEYRRNAEQCRKLAVGSLSDGDRLHLLCMAESWIELASSREELLVRHPELDRSGSAPAGAQNTDVNNGPGDSTASG